MEAIIGQVIDSSIEASQDEIDAQEHTEDSVVHKIKMALIILKITIVSLFLICAINQYMRKYKQCTVITAILAIYIVMLLILLAMDLTLKIIPVFFVLILLANYFNFVGFFYILRNLPDTQGKSLRRRTKAYFVVMNCLYVCVAGIAFVPGMRPVCTDKKAYPWVLTFASLLFLVNYLFHLLINCNKEYFMAETKGAPLLDRSLETTNPDGNGEGFEARKLSWEVKTESQSLKRTMFRRQMWFYLCFSTVLVTMNISIQIWGRLVAEDNQILGCAEHGYQWLYTTTYGEMFITAHIVQIIMQAVMLEKALFKVPHESGWFEAPLSADASDTEDEFADDQDLKKTADCDDDGYKAIN